MSDKKADAFDLDGIRCLVELMKENDVCELDLSQGGGKLRLKRGVSNVVTGAVLTPGAPVRAIADVPAQPAAPAPTPAPAPSAANLKTIVSPMVGTFYASSGPDAPPFVKVGDVVAPEKTVCIVEAMKIFNEIPAETSGKIVEVLVKNGDPVEFGSPLFKVEAQ